MISSITASGSEAHFEPELLSRSKVDGFSAKELQVARFSPNARFVRAHQTHFCLSTGKGVVQDYGEAFKWMSRAAEQGYAQAQINLGDL